MNVQPIEQFNPEGAKAVTNTFANTLRELMLEKRISASDLAREVWGTTKDKRGYDVARNRDRIGHYLSGKSYPGRDNLQKIAKVLGVKIDVLEKLQPTPLVRRPETAKDIQVTYFTEGQNSGLASLSMSKVHLVPKTVLIIMDLIAKDPIHGSKTKEGKKKSGANKG